MNLDDLIKEFTRLENRFDDKKVEFLGRAGESAKGLIQTLTPVDTGQLRGMWRAEPQGKDKILIYNNTEYAKYVNDGTRGRDGVHMLEIGLEDFKQDELPELLDNFLKEVIR